MPAPSGFEVPTTVPHDALIIFGNLHAHPLDRSRTLSSTAAHYLHRNIVGRFSDSPSNIVPSHWSRSLCCGTLGIRLRIPYHIFQQNLDEGPSSEWSSIYRRFIRNIRFSSATSENTGDLGDATQGRTNLPKVRNTGLTLQTLMDFIRRHHRQPGVTTLASAGISINDVEVEEYHDYRRNDAKPPEKNVTHEWGMRQSTAYSSHKGGPSIHTHRQGKQDA
ncbi:hypothetical protein K458DRAFT_408733 [Lentithecium fluviatile CBS 122367]|uniref:Uncharacterized protein n=1 Tax=Lentithecium fluviatile CBS 122367 TaxID=1168545 RepID=A0A6G1IL58_9PLEO|nr:hypothetical protein K458DRAFT_408733 [Lentithecium fluviatile CBS 122367]